MSTKTYSRWRAAFMVLLGAVLATIGVAAVVITQPQTPPGDALIARWVAMSEICQSAIEQHRVPEMPGLVAGDIQRAEAGNSRIWTDAGTGLTLNLSEQSDPPATLLSCKVGLPDSVRAPDALLAQIYVAFARHTRDLGLAGTYAPVQRPLVGGWLMLAFDSTRMNSAGCTVRALATLDDPEYSRAEITYFEVPPAFSGTRDCKGASVL